MNADRRFGWGSVIIAFVIGLLIGWFAIGWGVWPVEWKNTDPVDLRQEAREEYLVMVANDYAVTRDAATALRRLETWDPLSEADREIRQLAQYYEAHGQPDLALRLRALADGLPLPTGETTGKPEGEGGGGFIEGDVGLLVLVGFIVVGCVALALYLLRLRGPSFPEDRLREGREAVGAAAEEVAEEEERLAPPVEQQPRVPWSFRRPAAEAMPSWEFEAIYKGEGMEFERTFALEDQKGNYFGDCGVGAAAFVGEDTQRVNALEVWLFDKSDIRTETKVLMSQHAYDDEATREELAAKGEPTLAAPGVTFSLVGHSLRARGEVEEVEYLPGEPPNSAFARVSIRLRVSQQEG